MKTEQGIQNKLVIGKTRIFRPVCIQHPHGFYGGPAGYEKTDDKTAGPLIVKVVKANIPMSSHKNTKIASE